MIRLENLFRSRRPKKDGGPSSSEPALPLDAPLLHFSNRVQDIWLFEIIRTAPQDTEESGSEAWQANSACFAYIHRAAERARKNSDVQPEYQMTAKYWLEEFPRMDNRPRSFIVSLFTMFADSFLHGTLRKLVSSGTSVIPDHATLGKIILVDLPVKKWSELRQYAAVLMKFMTQKALERRPAGDLRPVFIWADEAHYFTTAYDQLFQTTARAARACMVHLTQNYYSNDAKAKFSLKKSG